MPIEAFIFVAQGKGRKPFLGYIRAAAVNHKVGRHYLGTIAKQSKLYNKLIANVLEISYL